MRRAAQLSFDDARRKAPAGPALTVLPDAARVEERLVRRATPAVFGIVACTLAQLERDLVDVADHDAARGRPPLAACWRSSSARSAGRRRHGRGRSSASAISPGSRARCRISWRC